MQGWQEPWDSTAAPSSAYLPVGAAAVPSLGAMLYVGWIGRCDGIQRCGAVRKGGDDLPLAMPEVVEVDKVAGAEVEMLRQANNGGAGTG